MRTKFSGIWKAVFVLLLVLFAAAAFAEQGGTEGGKKYNIKGKPVDRQAIEMLLDDSLESGEVEMDIGRTTINKLKGKYWIDKNKQIEEAAVDFIDKHRNAFGLKDPKKELNIREIKNHNEGDVHLHFNQIYNGVPIWGKTLIIHVDNNKLDRITSNNVSTPDIIDTISRLKSEEAIEKTIEYLNKMAGGKAEIDYAFKPTTQLVIYPLIKGEFKLAYLVEISSEKPRGSWDCFVDAQDGSIIALQDTRRY